MEFLSRWVEKIYPSKEAFIEALQSKKRLVIYHGVDPTAPHLHLRHSTNLFLLKKLSSSEYFDKKAEANKKVYWLKKFRVNKILSSIIDFRLRRKFFLFPLEKLLLPMWKISK